MPLYFYVVLCNLYELYLNLFKIINNDDDSNFNEFTKHKSDKPLRNGGRDYRIKL